MLSSGWRNEILAPGKLTTHHAQLLNRGDATNRCASCHAAGDQTFTQWLQHATNDQLAEPSQSELCLECHKNTIAPATAMSAHNVDPQVLLTGATKPATARHLDPTGELACATCHQEHHGTEHDLTWMSDNACQACHQQHVHSFASDHPDFDNWPTSRRTRIAFDHGAHQLKHFPKEKQEFACATCHEQSSDGTFQRTLGYDATCAKCHDSKIDTSWDAGVALFALPMIDAAALTDGGHDVGPWPEQASDEFDGPLPPLTKLLLVADENAAKALSTLGADFDFFDIDPDDKEHLQAAAEMIAATKRLWADVNARGQDAIRERIESVLDRKLAAQEFSALTARLSPENVAVIGDHWLANQPVENANREAARQRVAAGGWFSDDTTLSVRYRPTGHADPWVTAWIDVLAETTGGPHASLTEPLLKQWMAPTAPGQCGSCHSVDRLVDERRVVQWLAKSGTDLAKTFTKFSHGPHLTQAQLADCQSCHTINPLANVMESYAHTSPVDFQNGFQPLTKASCAECHTPRAAGDSCMQCHNYHVAP